MNLYYNCIPDFYFLFLHRLLDMVGTMSAQRVTQIREAMCLLECVECVRAIMNSKVGLEYFIHHSEPTRQLISG